MNAAHFPGTFIENGLRNKSFENIFKDRSLILKGLHGYSVFIVEWDMKYVMKGIDSEDLDKK